MYLGSLGVVFLYVCRCMIVSMADSVWIEGTRQPQYLEPNAADCQLMSLTHSAYMIKKPDPQATHHDRSTLLHILFLVHTVNLGSQTCPALCLDHSFHCVMHCRLAWIDWLQVLVYQCDPRQSQQKYSLFLFLRS